MIVLDEPTFGLDPKGMSDIRNALNRIREIRKHESPEIKYSTFLEGGTKGAERDPPKGYVQVSNVFQ